MTATIDLIRTERHKTLAHKVLEHAAGNQFSVKCVTLPSLSDQTVALQAAIGDGTSEFVTFPSPDGTIQPPMLTLLLSALSQSPASAAAIVVPSGVSTASWGSTPNAIAALWSRPFYSPLFRTSCLQEILAGLSAEAPEWDLLIRLTACDFSVAVCKSDLLNSVTPGSSHSLVPDRPLPCHDWLLRHLQQLDLGAILPGGDKSPEALALRAGLLQWHDYLGESHECSQQIEGQGQHRLGDHWHAIMHRREPDYGNSQYWYRRVGSSPIFSELAKRAATVLGSHPRDTANRWQSRLQRQGRWDACAFVDLCEASAEEPSLETIAKSIQEIEMELLFETTLACALRRQGTNHQRAMHD